MDPAAKRTLVRIPEMAWKILEYTDAIFDEENTTWICRAEVRRTPRHRVRRQSQNRHDPPNEEEPGRQLTFRNCGGRSIYPRTLVSSSPVLGVAERRGAAPPIRGLVLLYAWQDSPEEFDTILGEK